jgi:FAD/FMN-containing dehydrogenase
MLIIGTHGRSIHQGSFSSFIKSVTMIDGRGEKVFVDFDSNKDKELSKAVGLSVGLLGIFSVIELRVVPLYYLQSINFPQTVDWVCENWNVIQEESDYVELSYFPILDKVIVGRSMRMVQERPNAKVLEIGGPYKRRPDRDLYPPSTSSYII